MIRPAVAGDVPALARVQVRAWLHAYSAFIDPEEIAARPVEVREPQWRSALTDPANPVVTVVWDQDGAVAGFATTGPARDEDLDGGWGELYALYVDPGAWGSGAGRALIERAETHLADGYDEAALWVLEDNPRARRFYELAGWSPDGTLTEGEWFGVRATEVRYRKRLSRSRSAA